MKVHGEIMEVQEETVGGVSVYDITKSIIEVFLLLPPYFLLTPPFTPPYV